MRKNGKIYVPYILTCIITVAMFYMIRSLSVNESIASMHGGRTVLYSLSLGSFIVGIFAAVFLFYTHSFIVKRRQKEFGLYTVLGMEKRHLSIMLAFETLFVGALSIGVGLILGMALDKLLYLIVARILQADYGLGFFISGQSLLWSVALFACIYALIYAYAVIRVRIGNPIELLRGDGAGEKEPKTKRLMAITGALCLLSGYVCSLCTRDAVAAVELFFIAVLLVVVGTYFLFAAGSIALLKFLRRRKKYYYKTAHFIGVSGMLHRMKQNAVGLASICILATMLLVTVSTTASFMVGRNDMIESRYPYDIIIQSKDSETANVAVLADVRALAAEQGMTIEKEIECRYLSFAVAEDGARFTVREGTRPRVLVCMTADVYNRLADTNVSLAADEVLICESNMKYSFDTLDILGIRFDVRGKVDAFVRAGLLSDGVPDYGGLYVVVADDEALGRIYERQKTAYKENASAVLTTFGFDFDAADGMKTAFYEQLSIVLVRNGYNVRSACRAAQANEFMSLYGGLFFLGMYLGTLFLMATILIIYYKQISEGYEDKRRFEIMQKVGLSYTEVKKAIHSQILTVFFLPLVTAGIHVLFAFPMIDLLLGLASLVNTKLFALCTLGCFALFALVYVAVYFLTAKVYYRIVRADRA